MPRERPPVAVVAWHEIVASRDPAGLVDLLAEEVVFRSPAVHAPVTGRAAATAYLTAALVVLGPSLAYHRQCWNQHSAVLEFEATVDGRAAHGVDLLQWDERHRITRRWHRFGSTCNLEQTLVMYPALVPKLQSTLNPRVAQGDVKIDLTANFNNPKACLSGYLPVSQRRSPADLRPRAVDGDAHCKLPKSAREAVRGLRNLPCPNNPYRRAASPAQCGLIFAGGLGRRNDASTYVPFALMAGRYAKSGGLTYRLDHPGYHQKKGLPHGHDY